MTVPSSAPRADAAVDAPTPPVAPTPAAPAPGAGTQALVTRLTVAFNRRRAYPEGHPLIRSAEVEAVRALGLVLAERPAVAFGVGRDELLVDDQPHADGGAVARELAERLRARGVGRLTFDRAVTEESLGRALAWLAHEPPPGTTAPELAAAGVHVAPIAYGRLALVDGAQQDASTSAVIWRSLAAVALLDDPDEGKDRRGTAELVASGAANGGGGRGHGGGER